MRGPEDLEVLAADGWPLSMRRLPAAGEVRGAALLLPAMMVDRTSLDRPAGAGFASSLRAAGFEVFVTDFRGHGASGPGVEDGGDWDYDDLVRLDVPALVDGVRAAMPDAFLWVVGHSLGGHVSLAAAGTGVCEAPADGHLLLSSNVWLPSLEPSLARRAEKAASVAGLLSATRLAGHFPSRRLRIGPADEARRYIEDICRFWTTDRWTARDGTDYLEAMRAVEGPVLSIVGAGDRLMAHPEGARRWVLRVPQADFRCLGRRTPDLGLVFDPGHMGLVTDERSRPVWRWAADRMVEAMGR